MLPVESVRRGRGWRAVALHFPTAGRWLAWLPGPSLDGNPVLWREWHRNRPSRMSRFLWGLYWLVAIAGLGIGIGNAIAYGMDTASSEMVLITSLVMQSFLGMLLLSCQRRPR